MVHINFFLLMCLFLTHTLQSANPAIITKPTKLEQAITRCNKELEDEKKHLAEFEQRHHKSLQAEQAKVTKKQEELYALNFDNANLATAQNLADAHKKKALELLGSVQRQCDCWQAVKTQQEANECAMQRHTSLLFSEHVRNFSLAAVAQHAILAAHKDRRDPALPAPKDLVKITDIPRLLVLLKENTEKMVTAEDAHTVRSIEEKLIETATASVGIPDAQALTVAYQKCGACTAEKTRFIQFKQSLMKLLKKMQHDIITFIDEA